MYHYGIGYIGQGASYCFISTYFILFLTDYVGINSIWAGTISSVALLVEVIAGTVVGNLSDNCTHCLGRRRPFILLAALAMPPVLIALLHTVGGTDVKIFFYYLCFSVLFRVFFSCYEIPNNALGTEIAFDYDGRIRLRTISRFFSILGNGVGYILPLLMLQWFRGLERIAWQMTGVTIGLLCFLAWMHQLLHTEGYDRPRVAVTASRQNVMKNIFLNYQELLHLRSARILVAYKAAFSCGYALYNVSMLYFLQKSVGISDKYTVWLFLITVLLFFLMTPIVNTMALRMGKARQQMVSMGACGIVGIAVYFTASNSVVGAVIFILCFSFIQQGFWQLSASIFYDVVEVDEFANHKRRAGDLMSMVSVLGTLITAVMVQFFGFALDWVGYDSSLTVQNQTVIGFLNSTFILMPALFLLAGFFSLKAFPINKKTFTSLLTALQLRRDGRSYEQYLDDIRKMI